jgi:serine/threonine-protein kinase
LLAKRLVHHTTSDGELVMKVMTDPAPSLATVVPDVRADVALVVDRALAFDRELRYPDAKTMQRDVEELLRGGRPSYASSLPPLPQAPPSSVRSAPQPASKPEPPTFVPPAKRETTEPTSVDAPTRSGPVDIPAAAMPTRAESTRAAVVDIPDAALPTRVETRQPSMPHTPAGVVLTPFGELQAFVKPDDKRKTAYLAALVAVGLVVVMIFAALVIFALTRAHGDSGEGPSNDPVILKPQK